MDELTISVEAREESMRAQLAGVSAAASAAEAADGLAEAEREIAEGRGAEYGVGFGYVRSFGSPGGLDGVQLEYAVTDGARIANVHVVVSGTTLATLGFESWRDEPDQELRAWALDRLYRVAGGIPRADDRYVTVLAGHPLHLQADPH